MKKRMVTLITDGGCTPNPGVGGWGAYLIHEDGGTQEVSGGVLHSTNNQMELRAVLEGLKVLLYAHEVRIETDSQLVIHYLTRPAQKHWNADLRALRERIVALVKQAGHEVALVKVTKADTVLAHTLATMEIAKRKQPPLAMCLD